MRCVRGQVAAAFRWARFVVILGVIALGGMIMRDAVILIDQIQTEIGGGRDAWNAVVDAAVHRTRPVVLTAPNRRRMRRRDGDVSGKVR